jgi:hypothetical protein
MDDSRRSGSLIVEATWSLYELACLDLFVCFVVDWIVFDLFIVEVGSHFSFPQPLIYLPFVFKRMKVKESKSKKQSKRNSTTKGCRRSPPSSGL